MCTTISDSFLHNVHWICLYDNAHVLFCRFDSCASTTARQLRGSPPIKVGWLCKSKSLRPIALDSWNFLCRFQIDMALSGNFYHGTSYRLGRGQHPLIDNHHQHQHNLTEWNILEQSIIFYYILLHSITFQKMLEHARTCWTLLENARTC